ncbi:uncharacterized protein LOC118745202 isoform X2 [Rhagoletis pomonella]|uniref:uncharacterized protein LOC118745202 isoform X2 n=1 Tax=Rhagoletis pomonella TaxID=28610 RepID=UPI00177DCC74|nr:uncharacterized protein LOC118745202 isoform X2 [Rhagoletis pomonella]
MGDYKLLNKEIIDANRELKQTLSAYQTELVKMRGELMEQRRVQVEAERDYRDSLLSFWSQNFLSFARKIDENVNVLELLGHDKSAQSLNSHVGIRGQSNSTRRRSTQLVSDFRRSSAVCRQRSVVHMSPTRRQREDNAIEEEHETGPVVGDENLSGSDMDLDNSLNVIDVDNDETFENAQLRCIREGNEEEEKETDEGEEHNETYEESNRQPIRDVTNWNVEHRDPKACVATRRGKGQRLRNDSENSIELARNIEQDDRQQSASHLSEGDVEDDLTNILHCTLHVSRSANDLRELTNSNGQTINPFQNENLNRHLRVRVQRLHEPQKNDVHFANEENVIRPEEEPSSVDVRKYYGEQEHDPLLGITTLSLGDFQELCSSTPCHKRAQADSENRSNENSELYSFSSTCQTMRPSRRCAPKALAEPSLKEKLRSDSGKRRPKKR